MNTKAGPPSLSLSLEPIDKEGAAAAAPSAATGRVCARCKYTRQSSDTAPDWQCPSCQVAYDKVDPPKPAEPKAAEAPAPAPAPYIGKAARARAAAAEAAAAEAEAKKKAKARKKTSRELPTTWIGLGLAVVLVLGLVGWKVQADKARAQERAAKIEADARAAEVAAQKAAQEQQARMQALEKQARRSSEGPEAVKELQALAEKGDLRAMLVLGTTLRDGRGVAKDPDQAIQWLTKASNEGLALASVQLGYSYERGLGVTQQAEQAENLYQRAARQGDPSGLYSLGLLYSTGLDNVGRRPVAAHMLLDLAQRAHKEQQQDDTLVPPNRGAFWAAGTMRRLAPSMSIVEVAEAKRLADAWKPGQPFGF